MSMSAKTIGELVVVADNYSEPVSNAVYDGNQNFRKEYLSRDEQKQYLTIDGWGMSYDSHYTALGKRHQDSVYQVGMERSIISSAMLSGQEPLPANLNGKNTYLLALNNSDFSSKAAYRKAYGERLTNENIPKARQLHLEQLSRLMRHIQSTNPQARLVVVSAIDDKQAQALAQSGRKILNVAGQQLAQKHGADFYECTYGSEDYAQSQSRNTLREVYESIFNQSLKAYLTQPQPQIGQDLADAGLSEAEQLELAEFRRLAQEIAEQEQRVASLQQEQAQAERDYRAAHKERAGHVKALEEVRNQAVKDMVRGKKSSPKPQPVPKKKKGWSFFGKKHKASADSGSHSSSPTITVKH